jgi:uncharacterized protein (TIGR00255 family)
MISSMTGFGEAQLEEDGHAYHIELRSVNNRYLKASIRLPEEFAFLEPDIERMLRGRITRGAVTYKLSVRDLTAEAAPEINLPAVRRFYEQLRSIAPDDGGATIDLATLLLLPGMCQPHELSDAEREHSAERILGASERALAALCKMREVEGRELAADLSRNCAALAEQTQAVRALCPGIISAYRDRLTARVNELLATRNVSLAEDDLLKEIAVYADRCDVSEEISRLSSHLSQFGASLTSGEPAGRKLDFIAQEMLREANTIGSKASDAQIARRVIEMKSAIDRIKEQVQNVE